MWFKLLFLNTFLVLSLLAKSQSYELWEQLRNAPSWEIAEATASSKLGQQSALSAEVVGETDVFLATAKKFYEAQLAAPFKRSGSLYSTDWQRLSLFGSDTLRLHFFSKKEGSHFAFHFLCESKKSGFVSMRSWKYTSALKSLMSNQLRSYYLEVYDEAISDAQKNYDKQLKDLSKAEKKIENYQRSKSKKLDDADRAKGKIEDAKAKAAEAETKRKTITSEVVINNKELEYFQSERQGVQSEIAEKEADKLRYHSGSDSDLKRLEKLNKQIEKLKDEESKWMQKEDSKKDEIAKLESKMLDAERTKSNAQNSLNSLQLDVENAKRDAAKLDTQIELARKAAEEENTQVQTAQALLNSLKLAHQQVASR
jgi:hypothetical protein